MKLHFDYSKLAVEFLVVFVGVAVALAADEWRQELQLRDLEQSYLERLEIDIRLGRERILVIEEQFDSVFDAAEQLISLLDSKESDLDTSLVFELASAAGHSGMNQNNLSYSATYDELLSTGNLSIIRDINIRTNIVNHFRRANNVIEFVEELPLGYNARFKSITGLQPSAIVAGRIEPSPEIMDRLTQDLYTNDQFVEELRYFYAELGGGRTFTNAIRSIDTLLELL